ncbi:MAG TPA: hypothetical protein PKE12_00675 [Kiritimatiellia bacterium]|nr:hypothetical protein [Kiritimatiellia bacterium]
MSSIGQRDIFISGIARLVAGLVVAGVATASWKASAQSLRLGPFDFDARMRVEAIYTTNVEQERPSEAEADREDYYVVWSLALNSKTDMSPSTQLTLDTGVAIEKHFVRDDLDNSKSPFGRFRLASATEMRNLKVSSYVEWERTSESAEDVSLPVGVSRKTRNPGTRFGYGAAADWQGGPFEAGLRYEFDRERYEKDVFKVGDRDETTVLYYVGSRLRENLKLRYEVERTFTEIVNDPEDDPDWKVTETIRVDWRIPILERPELVYSFGLEKEDTDDNDGEWEIFHELAARDRIQFNDRLELTLAALYRYEQEMEDDEVEFTYSAMLRHEINRTTRQTLALTREPRATLGSTQDTDTTELRYSLEKNDFLFPNVTARFSADYEIKRPVDGPTEKILSYTFQLSHRAALTRRLSRTLEYMYDYEDSNLEDEILDEHRIRLSYDYAF